MPNPGHLKRGVPSLVFVFGVVSILVGLPACRRSAPFPSDQQQEAYRQAALPIVLWLERERAEKGYYPASLPSELQATLAGFVPAAKYVPYKTRTAYGIHVGEYRRDGWTYYYSSRHQRWTMDG